MRPARTQREIGDFNVGYDWDSLLASLNIGEILVLEQIYLVEGGPMPLELIRGRLRHLNVHRRAVARYCNRLQHKGLIRAVSSWDLQVSPVLGLEENIRRLVRLWQFRERRGRLGAGGSLHG